MLSLPGYRRLSESLYNAPLHVEGSFVPTEGTRRGLLRYTAPRLSISPRRCAPVAVSESFWTSIQLAHSSRSMPLICLARMQLRDGRGRCGLAGQGADLARRPWLSGRPAVARPAAARVRRPARQPGPPGSPRTHPGIRAVGLMAVAGAVGVHPALARPRGPPGELSR